MTSYPSSNKAEYPAEWCKSYAEVLIKSVFEGHAKKRLLQDDECDFSEIFSGENAPLTNAMRLIAKRRRVSIDEDAVSTEKLDGDSSMLGRNA